LNPTPPIVDRNPVAEDLLSSLVFAHQPLRKTRKHGALAPEHAMINHDECVDQPAKVRRSALEIRPYAISDRQVVWSILEPVFRAGETYAIPSTIPEFDALAYWTGSDRATFVAEDRGQIVGTYYLRANQLGGGDHVANCGYITAAWAMGRGIARAMCLHSLGEAAARGFRAMQFNLVVSTNVRALALWQDLGFQRIGTLPGAFRHPSHGYVDAVVMFRSLH
jgi:ribosomal protein S18 acetylase RimI-like enzyme